MAISLLKEIETKKKVDRSEHTTCVICVTSHRYMIDIWNNIHFFLFGSYTFILVHCCGMTFFFANRVYLGLILFAFSKPNSEDVIMY